MRRLRHFQLRQLWLAAWLWGCVVTCAWAADAISPEDRLHLADGLFRRTFYDLAAQEYGALAATPDVQRLDEILFRLAECYRRLEQSQEAEKVYQQLLERCPQSPQIGRAQLQLALLLRSKGALEESLAAFKPLLKEEVPVEVRGAALYYSAELLEKLQRSEPALQHYETLVRDLATTDYGMYAALRAAWLLTQRNQENDKRRALGLYLDLTHNAKNLKVVEEAYYFAANVTLSEARYAEAAQLYAELRKRFPEGTRTMESAVDAAWASYNLNLYQKAIQWLEPLLADNKRPRHDEILYLQANCLRQLGQPVAAVEFYQQLLQLHPKSNWGERAAYERMVTLFSESNYAEVIKMGETGESLPTNRFEHIHWMMAESATALKKPQIATQHYRLLVEQNTPNSTLIKEALYRLGWLAQKDEVWESAASWYQQVYERYGDDPIAAKALWASGICRSRLGQGEQALRDWTQLLTRYPESAEVPETLYQKAMEELRGENYRAAGATLDERMRRFPDEVSRQAESLYWRGVAFRHTAELAEAEKAFRACLAANPTQEFTREATLELGALLQENDKYDEAATLFQSLLNAPIATRLGPERIKWLAEFQLQHQRYEAALKAVKTLKELGLDRGWLQTAWTIQGRVHQAKNERDAAIAAFKAALETGAATLYGAEAALALGELLSENGAFDEAHQFLNEAATRAATPELLGIRARAYIGLAVNAERQQDLEQALRYYISVGILFDDAQLVPQALLKSADILEKLKRVDEARTMREELQTRYPDFGKQAAITRMLRVSRDACLFFEEGWWVI